MTWEIKPNTIYVIQAQMSTGEWGVLTDKGERFLATRHLPTVQGALAWLKQHKPEIEARVAEFVPGEATP